MMTASMSARFNKSLKLLPEPESSEYRSTLDPAERLLADLRDRE